MKVIDLYYVPFGAFLCNIFSLLCALYCLTAFPPMAMSVVCCFCVLISSLLVKHNTRAKPDRRFCVCG